MTAKKMTWQQCQAELKRAAIVDLLNRPQDESLSAAARRISKSYNGKRLPQGKRLKLSATSLKRLWYRWKPNPSDEVFDLHYAPAQLSVVQPWICHLFTHFAASSGLTLPQAYERLKAADPTLPFSSRTLRRHLPAGDQMRIAEALKLHRQQVVLDRKKTKFFEGTEG